MSSITPAPITAPSSSALTKRLPSVAPPTFARVLYLRYAKRLTNKP
jgi:hypothetical protein